MIFVITGTEAYPFNRLIQEIDRIKRDGHITDDVYIQLGSCTYQPKYCTWDNWLPFNKMCENIQNAEIIIAHAGAGTTLLCLELGKIPILVTRQKYFKEHLDDHQIPFAKMMEKLDYALVAYDVNDVKDCIDCISARKNKIHKYLKDNTSLINYLNLWLTT